MEAMMDGHTFAAARAEIVEMIKDLEPEALTIGQRILAARDEDSGPNCQGCRHVQHQKI